MDIGCITLNKASVCDADEIYDLQIRSFRALLEKYKDFDHNPGAEKAERTVHRLKEPNSDYYFISLKEKHIGALRIQSSEQVSKLKQIFILPEYQGHGYAQKAILMAEALYPHAKKWELDTILQEEKLCYLYEKMGYRKTGEIEHIKSGMDIVYFEKAAAV